MMIRLIRLTLAAAVTLVLAAGAAVAQGSEQKMQLKDLPQAVQNAIQQEAKGAELKGFAKEIEGGKTFYEAETVVNGHTRDLLFDPEGHLVEVEEAIAVDALPAAVRSAFESRGKILKTESVTKGKTVTYEAQVEKNGKKSEVAVDATGKRIKG